MCEISFINDLIQKTGRVRKIFLQVNTPFIFVEKKKHRKPDMNYKPVCIVSTVKHQASRDRPHLCRKTYDIPRLTDVLEMNLIPLFLHWFSDDENTIFMHNESLTFKLRVIDTSLQQVKKIYYNIT